MNSKKAKAIRKFLGKELPRIVAVEDGKYTVMVNGTPVEKTRWKPRPLSEDEVKIKNEYRRLKKMYKSGDLSPELLRSYYRKNISG